MPSPSPNPYVLIVVPTGQQPVMIDLDQPGWLTTHQALLGLPGRWILGRKADSTPALVLVVNEGDQPSYLSRTIGVALLPPPDALGMEQAEMIEAWKSSEIRAFSLGKTRANGEVERMWMLPNGATCIGDDVDALGAEMAKINLFAALRRYTDGPDDRRHQAEGKVQRPEAQGLAQEEADHLQEDGGGGPRGAATDRS